MLKEISLQKMRSSVAQMKLFQHAWSRLLSLIFYFVLLIRLTLAIPGNYETFPILQDKRLSDFVKKYNGITQVEKCKNFCVEHSLCEAFAFSSFERTCVLYELKLGTPPITHNGFKLYVRAKTEEEGYYRDGTNYFKLILERKKFNEAQKTCEKMNGMLVAVRSEEQNELLQQLMEDNKVFYAYIGLTDVMVEETWKYMDGVELKDGMFDNWNYNGHWYRRDKNCAVILIDGNWYHHNCENPCFFFCQIPMF